MENYEDLGAIKNTLPLGFTSPAIEKEVDNSTKRKQRMKV